MIRWSEFAVLRPDLEPVARGMLYQHGLGLGFLATVRTDGGPRVHPICPVLAENLYAFIVPGPKLADLRRDGRYALCSETCAPPRHDDNVYLTGRVEELDDAPLRQRLTAQVLAERGMVDPWPGFDQEPMLDALQRRLVHLTRRLRDMRSGRVEAFSDGVIAILITIMVLELHVPHGTSFHALRPLLPVWLTYVLSFTNLGIYWNNHHHLLQLTDRVNGRVLWANLHLLFWLSLFPFATGWMGENGFAALPTAGYGMVLLLASIAYYILQTQIIAAQGPRSRLGAAIGRDWKGKASPCIYMTAIIVAFGDRWVALSLYVLVALIWLVPDSRLERAVQDQPGPATG